MNNTQIQAQPQRMTFSNYVNSKVGKDQIAKVIQNPNKRDAFITSIVAAVSTNPALQECTSASIISAALQGVAMGLAPSPQLGQFYMVPFKQKEKKDKNGKIIQTECTVATFIPGYRGYIQLAYRSGQYVDLDARPVVEGEYKGLDRITGRATFEWIEDDALRERLPVVGYMAYFELINGARKVLYWSKEKMISHANRFSPAFSRESTQIKVRGQWKTKVSFDDFQSGNYPKEDEWMYSSFWYKDFDMMACKTMIRQLITRWGPVSVEMESAIVLDTQSEAQGVDYGADFSAAALPPTPDTEPVVDVVDEAAEDTENSEEQVTLNDV